MLELLEVFILFPWNVKLLILSPLLALPLVWLLRPKIGTDSGWVAGWQNTIDSKWREVRKHYSRKERKLAIKMEYIKLMIALEGETGPLRDFIHMESHHKAVWLYFLKRVRELT